MRASESSADPALTCRSSAAAEVGCLRAQRTAAPLTDLRATPVDSSSGSDDDDPPPPQLLLLMRKPQNSFSREKPPELLSFFLTGPLASYYLNAELDALLFDDLGSRRPQTQKRTDEDKCPSSCEPDRPSVMSGGCYSSVLKKKSSPPPSSSKKKKKRRRSSKAVHARVAGWIIQKIAAFIILSNHSTMTAEIIYGCLLLRQPNEDHHPLCP